MKSTSVEVEPELNLKLHDSLSQVKEDIMLEEQASNLQLMEGIPLTINQVAMIAQVSKSTLRYWEKTFSEFLNPDRNEGGRRVYFADDVRRILEVKRILKQEGYTISGARKKLGLAA